MRKIVYFFTITIILVMVSCTEQANIEEETIPQSRMADYMVLCETGNGFFSVQDAINIAQQNYFLLGGNSNYAVDSMVEIITIGDVLDIKGEDWINLDSINIGIGPNGGENEQMRISFNKRDLPAVYVVNFVHGGYGLVKAFADPFEDEFIGGSFTGYMSKDSLLYSEPSKLPSYTQNDQIFPKLPFAFRQNYEGSVASIIKLNYRCINTRYRLRYGVWRNVQQRVYNRYGIKYHQRSPYNDSLLLQNAWVGCGPIALLTLFAYNENPTQLGSVNVNWQWFKEQNEGSQSIYYRRIAAKVSKYLVNKLACAPTTVGTYTDPWILSRKLRTFEGYEDAHIRGKITDDYLYNYVYYHGPIICAYSVDLHVEESHYFVVDGCIKLQRTIETIDTYNNNTLAREERINKYGYNYGNGSSERIYTSFKTFLTLNDTIPNANNCILDSINFNNPETTGIHFWAYPY